MRRFFLVLLAGCVHNPGKCPMASFKIPFDNGSAQWSYDTITGSIALADVRLQPPATVSCAGGSTGNARWNPDATEAILDGQISLRCVAGDHEFAVSVSLGDVPKTTAGTTIEMSASYSYMIPGQSDVHLCEGRGMATVTVRDVAGGAAPTPDLVTPDFTRTFDIHIDGSMPVTGKAIDQPCSPISVELTTTVKIDAADIDSQPDFTCPTLG